MRFSKLILVVLLSLLVACKVLPQGNNQQSFAPDAQSSENQAAPTANENPAADAEIRPKPRPASLSAAAGEAAAPDPEALAPAAVAPVVVKSQEQIKCENRGGDWGNAGNSGAKACVKRTRDAGKQCRKQSDCTSFCLARSGTCAPFKPLFGCNDILQDDGSRVNICIN